MAAALLLEIQSVAVTVASTFTLGSSFAPTPPLTPTASSPVGGTLSQTQSHAAVPTLQLTRSRLKTASNARDTDLDIELLGLENCRLMQQLM
ncbi:Zinc finger CCCH domain-containing protein 66 [Sesbania bispinosa]|nr:Zinc finger CCCH domain-containing protein 66 [Sesbania bispinosa]